MKLEEIKGLLTDKIKVTCEAVETEGYDYIYFENFYWKEDSDDSLTQDEHEKFFDYEHDWRLFGELKTEVYEMYCIHKDGDNKRYASFSSYLDAVDYIKEGLESGDYFIKKYFTVLKRVKS